MSDDPQAIPGAPRGRRPTAPDGLLVVDKPAGWTSHDVVAKLRGLAGTRRVGHAGTLDPMATGVLVVGVGRATRLLTFLVGADKEYTATVRLGVATTTDDAEGEVLAETGVDRIDAGLLAAAAARLTGPIQQVPATVSAIKVDGQRAYARARAGEHVELAARPVTVRELELGEPRPARTVDGTGVLDVDLRVVCSSGTYVRALARDLGVALGVGGHLTALRRTRVGGWSLASARTLDDLSRTPPDVPLEVVPLATAARQTFGPVELDADQAVRLGHGATVVLDGTADAAPLAAFAPDGSLVALVTVTDGRARPLLVLAGG